jgi:hypothetical protein
MRWLAYRHANGEGVIRVWDRNAEAAKLWCRHFGHTYVGVRTDVAQAGRLLDPPTDEQQSATLVAELTASVARTA